jgi:protein-arginine kinase
VSALVHLPVLTMQKRISDTVSPVKESGFQITGTLGAAEELSADFML